MKNLTYIRTKSMTAILLLSTFALFFTSCQKEDLTPMNLQDPSHQHSEVSRTSSTAYTMIVIDHQAAQTGQRSFRIEIKSDGTVLFTGRNNTAFIGEKKMKVSAETISKLDDAFKKANFKEIELLPMVPDLALIETSFSPDPNQDVTTRRDYNDGNLAELVDLRTQTEEMLNLSKLINTKRNINSLKANMAHESN